MYSLSPDQPCTDCLSEAVCYGNFTMVPKEGYWRPSIYTDKLFECPNSKACKGSQSLKVFLLGECAEGYRGNMCQACENGYSRTPENKCGLQML
mmetsp:Transcript_12307/g.23361  ORF Transcript_12307/g.23361 Transcript_12307/m.23361 type:complete len:94 (+) Transcript_12307:650-931(+)